MAQATEVNTRQDSQFVNRGDQALLRPAGPAPVIDVTNCKYTEPTVKASGDFSDLSTTLRTLEELSSNHARWLAREELIPLAWFLRLLRDTTFESVAVAVHEATHFARRRLTSCASGMQTYMLEGGVYRTALKQGTTRHISFVAKHIPPSFPADLSFRFRRYILDTNQVVANQFPTILDELIAYTASAEIEILLLGNSGSPIYLRPEVERFNGNVAGSVEFMLFCFSYLKGLKTEAAFEYDQLMGTEGVVELLRAVWRMYMKNQFLFENLDASTRSRIPTNQSAQSLVKAEEFRFIRELLR